MTMTDPIGDMLTRIRNGLNARKKTVRVPASNVKKNILAVMKEEGYITDFQDAENSAHPEIEVTLKYFEGKAVISDMARVSRPGLREYTGSKEIPMVRHGLGINIVSTSKGVMTDTKARSLNVGGEILCRVF